MRIFIVLCLAISGAWAKTEKYRIMWRDDPATSMVVGWVQESGQDAAVHYGIEDKGQNCDEYAQSQEVDRQTEHAGMQHRFARLEGLEPNTTYYFVICDDDGASSRMYFKTAPNDAQTPFTIVAGGDSRNNEDIRRMANVMVSKLRPLFVMFGGDMTNKSSDAEWKEWLEDWQLTRSEDGRMYPIMAARGNHEKGNKFVTEIFDTPGQDAYYSLGFGNGLIRIWTLNTEISKGGNQAEWLKSDLENHDDVVWKLAHYHKPIRPHVSGKSEGNGQYQYWAQPFHQHRMNLVVECDAHTVKHTWPLIPSDSPESDMGFVRDDDKGTVYIGEGCWGAPLRNADDKKSWTRDMDRFNSFHWIHVDGPSDMSVRTIKIEDVESVQSKIENEDPFKLYVTFFLIPYSAPGNQVFDILGTRIWNEPKNQIPMIFHSVNSDTTSPGPQAD